MTYEENLIDRCSKLSFTLGFVFSALYMMTEEEGTDIDIKNKVIELDKWLEERLSHLFYKDK